MAKRLRVQLKKQIRDKLRNVANHKPDKKSAVLSRRTKFKKIYRST